MSERRSVRTDGGETCAVDMEQQLRELVDEWREKADTLCDIHERYEIDNLGEVSQVEILADELEAVLDGVSG